MGWWLAYGLACALTWYENYFVVRERGERPHWYASPTNQSLFWISKLVMAYGSMLGLLWRFGVAWAVGALVAYQVFAKITFRRYFAQAVATEYRRILESMNEDPKPWGVADGDTELSKKALEFATRAVIDNMQNEP